MKLGIDCGKIQVESKPPAGEDESPPAPGTPAESGTDAGKSVANSESAAPEPGPKPGEILISLPPIKILSHEVYEDTIEVFEQSQTIFNEIKIEEAFKITGERKREMEEKVFSSGTALDEARASLELQFGKLLQDLPGIKDTYTVVFLWRTRE
jgi:hypothetical protein